MTADVAKAAQMAAIEVKSSATVDSRALKGLRSIKDLAGLRKRTLVCGVDQPERTEDGIEILPFERFARESSIEVLFAN